jgi:hypothetical protein
MKKTILILGTIFLTAVFALKFYFQLVPNQPSSLNSPISEIIPKEIKGWSSEDFDLAESSEASERISSFLNLDDSLFRVFKNGSTTVGVYVAYWTPGKVSYRWAGAHTPDTCWVVSGWERLEREYSIPFKTNSHQLKNAEFGVYKKDGNLQNVYFWHLVGGAPFSYEQKEIPNIFGALIDIQKYGLNLRQEQFFIRLSSNRKIEELSMLPGFDKIIKGLGELNLSIEQSDLASARAID